MGMSLKKILTVGLAAALATTMCVSFADGNDDDDKEYRNRHKVLNALEPSVDTEETIVVSLASNPLENPEPACVALLIATNLLKDVLPTGDPANPEEVTPADSVTLFATLDGVELADLNNDADLSDDECVVNTAGDKMPLLGIRNNFLVSGGEILVCPLCMVEREITEDDLIDGAEEATAVDIHELFLTADKVLSF
jgi:predicted peroxiredoxin